jgi:chemotaxis protein methyltransferase CheR
MSLLVEDQLNDRDFKRISDAVYEHCGINLHDGKKDLVRARLSKRVRATNSGTFTRYIDTVLADPDGAEFCELIDSISTNLTSFFRENQHFEFLAKQFLPPLLAAKKKAGKTVLRAWSAGCSTGEEPHTIGIVVLEALAAAGGAGGWDVKLLASDISTRVLKKATLGIYEPDRVAQVPAGLRAKYFEPRKLGGGEQAYACVPAVRNLISFRHVNLMEPWPFSGPFDFVFCRNVMIYFDKPTQEKLVNRYHDVLAPGGVLFTGHSESLTGIKHPFKFVQPTIYRKG